MLNLLITANAALVSICGNKDDTHVYNTGERVGPPSRPYITVGEKQAEEEAYKKNLLWVVARLHSSENQCVSGWTGFNISVRDTLEVRKDVVEY